MHARDRTRRWHALAWLAGCAVALSAAARGAEAPSPPAVAAAPAPMLVVDPGVHTAPVRQIAVDATERTLASVSDDKSARLWDVATGRLLATLRPPAGHDDVGRLYGAAISSRGTLALAGTTASRSGSHRIYLYDLASRAFLRAIDARGGDVKRLQWSPDGRALAAAYAGRPAVRVFDLAGKLLYEEPLAADAWSLAFSSRGELAVPVSDGTIRLYAVADGVPRPAGTIRTSLKDPRGVHFSPDGRLLAVGYLSRAGPRSVQVDVFDVAARERVRSFAFDDITEGNLRNVSWQSDGAALYAGGSGYRGANRFVVKRIAWPQGTTGDLIAGTNSITDLVPLSGNRMVFATAEPGWGVIEAERATTSVAASSGQFYEARALRVNRDATQVAWRDRAESRMTHFALTTRRIAAGAGDATIAAEPASAQLRVTDWENHYQPKLAGAPIPMQPSEVSRAAAVALDGAALYLATSRTLRRLAADGRQVWSIPLAVEARALALSSDAKLLVVGMLDGTVRWRRAADGALLMSLFAAPDGRWVLWSEQGYYDASVGAEALVGWLVNRPGGEQADYYEISRFRDTYYRPDILDRMLAVLDEPTAVAAANQERRERAARAEEAVRDRVDKLTAPARVTAILPPVVQLVSPAVVESPEPRVAVDYRLYDPDPTRPTVLAVRVDGRPHDAWQDEPPARRDGEALGRLQIALPRQDAVVQVLASNAHGASSPAGFNFRLTASVPAPALPPAPPAPKPAPTPAASPPTPAASPPTTASAPLPPTVSAEAPVAPKTTAPLPTVVVGVADPRPKLFLLAIGVSKYANPAYDLVLADKDAADFANAFRRQSGMFYRAAEIRLLDNQRATRQTVIEGLQWLKTVTTDRDVGVVYVAGHGVNDVDDTYYFLPHDAHLDRLGATAVPEGAFRDALSAVRGKTVFFIDTCYSGKSMGTLSNNDLTRISNKLASPEHGVIVFSASHGRQESLESPDWGNGAFTKALIAGVDGAADFRRQGVVTHRGLDYYVGYEVTQLTKGRQTPVTMVPVAVADFGIAASLAR